MKTPERGFDVPKRYVMNDDRHRSIAGLFSITLVATLFELYYFNYAFFYEMGLGSAFFEQKANNISHRMLFQSPLHLRLLIVVLSTVMVFLSRPKVKIDQEASKTLLVAKTLGVGIIYLLSHMVYSLNGINTVSFYLHIALSIVTIMYFINCLAQVYRHYQGDLLEDRHQREGRRFDQFKKLLENPYSVNIRTEDGYVNIVNPFRGSQVIGTPGSGKTYSFLIEALVQSIEKGYSIMLYDYKFPSLTNIAHNVLAQNLGKYGNRPQFCIINFDDIKRSHRCNPLQPELLLDPTDATGAAQALMYGLYPKWAQKQGEFFTESSINFVGACIWALKKLNNGRFCTLPHLIQFLSLDYKPMFHILLGVEDAYINNVIAPFISAFKQKATDQLEGQIGTTRIALSRLTSPSVYWIMSPAEGESISLQLNDPLNPKVLCLANNPDKQSIYGPILSLYNTRIMRLINKPNMLKTAVFLDELPTLGFPPGTLDNLIATARSNKIAVWLGYQDFSQLNRDMGKDIAEAIINTVGNTFSGMVNFDTAEKLSKKFGRIKIRKKNITVNKDSTSIGHSTEMTEMIPASDISQLPQGVFVGQVADDRGYEMDQKVFYSKILIDHKKRAEYEEGEIPEFQKFDKPIQEIIEENFNKIKNEINDLAEAYSCIIDNIDAIGQISDN